MHHLKYWIVLHLAYATSHLDYDQLTILSKTHSTHLEKYYGYIDILLLHFKVPENTRFVSFKFQAEENALSLFSCKPKDVSVYLKAGSPPVINPDGSELPEVFLSKESRPKIYSLNFQSNGSANYVNITGPLAGSYFAAAFRSYTDPKFDGIIQSGLTPDCLTFLNAGLYASRRPLTYMVVPHKPTHVLLTVNTDRLFKFHTPEGVDDAFLTVTGSQMCEMCHKLIVRIRDITMPTEISWLHQLNLRNSNGSLSFRFAVQETCWYFLDFILVGMGENDTYEFVFQVDYYAMFAQDGVILTEPITDKPKNNTGHRNGIVRFNSVNYPYEQYNLVREGRSESFMYSFDLQPDSNGIVPLALNFSNLNTTVLKFHINSGLDIGGTLQFSLSFKPVLVTRGKVRWFQDGTENHTIVGCLRNGAKEIPTWPNVCVYNGETRPAVVVLNKTTDNDTVYVPYPEPGDWYASFKLFCEPCKPCLCPKACRDIQNHCALHCRTSCSNITTCTDCTNHCQRAVLNRPECTQCDCDGPCEREEKVCNSTAIFVIESFPCITGKCGRNGKCVFVISEGLAYSICVCTNNYRGWDCFDGSQANTYGMIVLELLLLVLSNLMFLPAVYVALKRKYYVEAIVYFSACFFSTFYHACDAGENVISFCLVRLSVLQFSDFFCGLLSIWVTLIAIGYLRKPWPSVCHITGAICLAFGTSVNKTSLWVFVVPFVTGIVIVAVSWYFNYRKGSVIFPSRRYVCVRLPAGVLVAGVGLLMYALLQTHSNYKYVHSLWHVLMATVIIIMLPDVGSFKPLPTVNNSD